MRIETKYNINDELWFMMGNRVHCKKVIDIKIELKGQTVYKATSSRGRTPDGNYLHAETLISYIMESNSGGCFFMDPVKEGNLFKTKAALIKSL